MIIHTLGIYSFLVENLFNKKIKKRFVAIQNSIRVDFCLISYFKIEKCISSSIAEKLKFGSFLFADEGIKLNIPKTSYEIFEPFW